MAQLIEVEDLVKVYPDGTRAVDGVSFDVPEGELFGFLGPNGAGKTTIIRILVTLLPRTSGTARIGGFDVGAQAEQVRRMIGYAAQFIGVDDDLSARENLVLQARLHGVAPAEAARRADELLEVFSLTEVANKRAGSFSGGMRRRLDLAQALVHRPPLVFLDEPTTGLDPQNRNALWRHLTDLNRAGTTIFLTTQYLEEADHLCARVAIIDHGRIAVVGSPEELKRSIGGDVVTVTLAPDAAEDDVARLLSTLAALDGAGEPTRFDHSVALPLKDAGGVLSDLVRKLDDSGLTIAKLSVASPSLDEVFLRYTGEVLRVEETGRNRSANPMMGRRRRMQ
jgi:daunorubicin resistance ABC transporter ATP-binding subunit